ncbi:MAG: tRNA (guanosine(46)-N7)-methyltransferase TrmB [Thermoguttaceae bacterium]|nr:tRNA (guanosine(46)-N7)-methyltransferase TrmB [Thermoguttaceae bacterium]
MPRRSLSKIQSGLDLSHYFLPMEVEFYDDRVDPEAAALAQPCDGADKVARVPYATLSGLSFEELSERLFDRVAPLEFEIGSGKGLFISTTASANRARNFLGVEIAYRYALLSASRLAKRGAYNGVMMAADAAKVLREVIPLNSLTAAHIYFPDPWWKKAHRKRRIVRPDVVEMIEARLIKGGRLNFWTDVKEYFDSGVEIIKTSTNLAGPFPVKERPAADSMDFRTHFERRTRLNEQPVYRSFFEKRF